MRYANLIAVLAAVLALGAAKAPEPGTSVEMPYLIAPLTVDGKLVAYAYISTQIIATSPATAIEIRLKVPFIQDAFVRDVNASTVGTANDPQAVDSNALNARLLADARGVAGADKVAGIRFTAIQISQIRPAP